MDSVAQEKEAEPRRENRGQRLERPRVAVAAAARRAGARPVVILDDRAAAASPALPRRLCGRMNGTLHELHDTALLALGVATASYRLAAIALELDRGVEGLSFAVLEVVHVPGKVHGLVVATEALEAR